MKTKAQKQEDLKAAEEMLGKSQALVFADFGKITAENMRQLRRTVKENGGELKVVKKRLLNVLFKDKGIDYDVRQFDGSVGTIFSKGAIDQIGGPVYRFLAGLGADAKSREASSKKLLGAYDLQAKAAMDQATVLMIGRLPSREVLLGQLLGMLAAPMSQLMYTLQQKSEQK